MAFRSEPHTGSRSSGDRITMLMCKNLNFSLLINYYYRHLESAEAHSVSTVLPHSASWLGDHPYCKNSLPVVASVENVGQHFSGS
jgi:hypothetical protein